MELPDVLNISPEPSRTEHNVRGPLLVLSVLRRKKHRIQGSPQLQLLGPHVMGVHACFFSRRKHDALHSSETAAFVLSIRVS